MDCFGKWSAVLSSGPPHKSSVQIQMTSCACKVKQERALLNTRMDSVLSDRNEACIFQSLQRQTEGFLLKQACLPWKQRAAEYFCRQMGGDKTCLEAVS